MFAYLIVIIFTKLRLPPRYFFFFIMFIILSVMHFILNPHSDISIFIKISASFVFFIPGRYMHAEMGRMIEISDKEKLIVALCFCSPTFLRIYQIFLGLPDDEYYAIFVNSNVFAFYMLGTSMALYYLYPKKAFFLLFLGINFAISKTLGALLATIVSGLFYYRNKLFVGKTPFYLVLVFAVVASFIIYSDLEIFQRLRNTHKVFVNLISTSSIAELSRIEYGDAVRYAERQDDISFLFRIKHWSEIIHYWLGSSAIHQIFGHGFLTVETITTLPLIAHNDYLGIIFEFGLLPFVFLFIAYISTLIKLKAEFISIPLFAIAFYHLTENLYTNFLITSLYFYLSGLYLFHVQENNKAETEEPDQLLMVNEEKISKRDKNESPKVIKNESFISP